MYTVDLRKLNNPVAKRLVTYFFNNFLHKDTQYFTYSTSYKEILNIDQRTNCDLVILMVLL